MAAYRTALLGYLLALSLDASAAGSLLRIACDGNDIGAEVTINGVFKGDCPLDVQVGVGTLQIRVLKKVDASRERVFEQEIRMGDGVVKKVEVALSSPRLNAQAQRQEEARLAVERAEAARHEEARQLALAEERRRDEEALRVLQSSAEAGDSAAMMTLGERYATGKGVPKSDEQATAWFRKAATAGSVSATFRLSDAYKTGKKPDVEAMMRILALPLGPERSVMIFGEDQIRNFAANDPFFEVPGGTQKISYVTAPNPSIARRTTNCVRTGRLSERSWEVWFSSSPNESGEEISVIGGLLQLKIKHGRFLFWKHSEIDRLEKLQGQPFPLAVDHPFRWAYVSKHSSGMVFHSDVICGLDAAGVESISQSTARQRKSVVCYVRTNQEFENRKVNYERLERHFWSEASGCFVPSTDGYKGP